MTHSITQEERDALTAAGSRLEPLNAVLKAAAESIKSDHTTHTEPAPMLWDSGYGSSGPVVVAAINQAGVDLEGHGVGYWVWIIAGRVVSSAFKVHADDPEGAVKSALAAREELVKYVQSRFPVDPRQPESVGVIEDGGVFPRVPA